MRRLREFSKIVLLCIGAAITYGVVHDQITARICIEYFTVAHPPVFSTDSPTLLGLGWGVLAAWWAGAFLGVVLALAALAGRGKIIPATQLIRSVVRLLLVMALGAVVLGLTGYLLTRNGLVGIAGWEEQIPANRHHAFAANLWAHSASYLIGFVGGLGLAIRTGWQRWRHARETPQPA